MFTKILISFFLRATVWRPFMIFEGCLDSNPKRCRSKQARYKLSYPSLNILGYYMFSKLSMSFSVINVHQILIPLAEIYVQWTDDILVWNTCSANCQYPFLKSMFSKLPISLNTVHVQKNANILGFLFSKLPIPLAEIHVQQTANILKYRTCSANCQNPLMK